MNAGGFLACNRFVSHVTGFATLFGIDLARGKLDQAIGILSVPVYFLLGAVVSALLVDRQYQSGRRPHYAIVMAMVCTCLLIAAIGGHLGIFNQFGGDLKLRSDYLLLALLCMASGLQNATITSATGSRIRTTHLTGLTTDLGLGLVRSMNTKLPMGQRQNEARINQLRIWTWFSFAMGSAISAVLYLRVGYLGFLLPASLALYATASALRMPPQRAPGSDLA